MFALASTTRQNCARAWPQELGYSFGVKPSIALWNSLQDSGAMARRQTGATTWTQTWTLLPYQRVGKVWSHHCIFFLHWLCCFLNPIILGPYHLFSTPPLNFSLHPKIFPLRQIGCHSHKMLRESRGDYHCLCLLTIFFHFCVTRNGIASGTV